MGGRTNSLSFESFVFVLGGWPYPQSSLVEGTSITSFKRQEPVEGLDGQNSFGQRRGHRP